MSNEKKMTWFKAVSIVFAVLLSIVGFLIQQGLADVMKKLDASERDRKELAVEMSSVRERLSALEGSYRSDIKNISESLKRIEAKVDSK